MEFQTTTNANTIDSSRIRENATTRLKGLNNNMNEIMNKSALPRHRKQKNSHRIRRRRASTGQKFGEIQTAPSSSLSVLDVSSSRLSPVSVCDTSKSSSFDEAFKNGTVLPYVFDSAIRSITISLCSSFSVPDDDNNNNNNNNAAESIPNGPRRFLETPTSTSTWDGHTDDDFNTSSSEDGKDEWREPIGRETNSSSIGNGAGVGLIPPLPSLPLHNRDSRATNGNGNSIHLRDRGSSMLSPRVDPLEDAREPQHDNIQGTLENPLSQGITLQSDDSSSNNAPTPGKSSRSTSSGSKGSSTPSSKSMAVETGTSTSKRSTSKSSTSELERVHVQHPGADRSALKELPALRDAPPAKREELFILKLKLCSVIFSFDDPMADKRGKDMKRQTLLELVDYVNTPAGQKIFTESVMGDLMAMVSANVCRALPPATDDFDPEEDEPVLEPAWPHLQVAYEFFLRFIVSSEVNAKAAKKYVDQKFCLQLVELFDSEDPRERDYLKTILHRIYGKFMSHRSFIRRAISNVFYRFVYETERHNGIGELLEILGSIINGFAIPLKKEHLQFLVRALIPLHKPKCVALYHQQLSYCIIQYVEKDADTATPILNGFFKCWPWSSSGKQVMFLNELEEILELLGADQLAQVSDMLFTNLARCLDSDHFQVVERALFLWNNEHLVNSGCLSRLNAQAVLPIIYGPLYKNSSGHWNATVEGLAQNVLKMYMEYDLVLYDRCTASYFRDEEEAKRKLAALEERWAAIENVASTSNPSISVK